MVKERYASKTDYLRTKRSCDITRDYKSCISATQHNCKSINVHPLKIGHSEKEVYHGTKLPGRYPISGSGSGSGITRYQLLHRDTSRSGAIQRKKLQVLYMNQKSSNINQSSSSCSDENFERFPCKN
jgi:hypothetical protein